jgi:CubicO group peptidase (beta-lactamase class C family)
MNHTSGYPDYYPLDFMDRRMLKDISAADLGKEYAGGKLDFEPGSRYSYSNTGYILLGDIAEKVSGESLGTFLTKRIFKPLEMTNTRYLNASDLPNRAVGHWSFALGAPEKASDEPPGWLAGAGGIWSTANDMLKWDLAIASGKVFKPETFKVMTTPRTLRDGRISNYGCGLATGESHGERTLGHSGAVFGFLANNVVFPRSRSAVVLLSNTEHVRPNALFRSLVELVAKDHGTLPVPKIDGPAAKEVVLEFFKQWQEGKIDRAKLGEEFNFFMSEERVKDAAPRLKALGTPSKVEATSGSERGGMEVVVVTLTFKDKVVKASLYRTPDGKIQQLLLNQE